MLIVAVFIAGGCGGSSSNSFNQSQQQEETSPFDSTTEEHKIVFEELEQELKAEGLTVPPIHYVAVISGDHAILEEDINAFSSARASGVRAATTLPDEEIQRMSAILKPYYDKGDVIAMVFPEPETINDVFAAIGEPEMYVDPIEMIGNDPSDDLVPLVYAVAKRYNGEAIHRFSYILPLDVTWLVEELVNAYSGDVSQEETSSDGEIGEINYEDKYADLDARRLYQARRMADFHRWAAHIDSEMEKQVAYVSSPEFALRAAGYGNESRSGELFNYGAQKISVNLSSSRSITWNNWGVGTETATFSSAVNYTIYSFHDFGDAKDYYYVQSNSFVKPESYREWTQDGYKKTLNSMRYFDFSHQLNNATYNLFSNAPKNVNRSRTLSDGTSYSTTGTTTHSMGVEAGFEAGTEGAKASMKANYEYSTSKSNTAGYTHSATWTTEDWEVINQCNNTIPSWRIDFKDPSNGYDCQWNGDVAAATTRRSDLDSEWLWQVSNAGKNLSITVNGVISYRLTGGNGKLRGGSHAERYISSTVAISQPPHIMLDQKRFSVQRNGHLLQTGLTTGGNWTATTDVDWCQVSPTSGGATAGDAQVIFFNVDPFTQDGALATREGHISFKDTTTGQTQTIWITQTNFGS